jgi:Protein of unknown function (DUF3467)
MADGEDGEDQEAQIVFDQAQMAGVWANFARVSHSEHEFTLDFVRLDYASGPPIQGVVVSRVSVSPLFVTQLVDALQENWTTYAAKAMPREVRDAEHDEPDDSAD